MAGEIALKKLYANNASAYIVDDLQEAQRRFFLAKNLIVIPVWTNLASAATTYVSDSYELSGKTHFTVEIANVGAGTGSIKLQGSVTGTSWSDISSAISVATPVTTCTSEYPFRYYRFSVSTALTASTTVYLAAIAK